ncbi:MFS transporter [Curtobacterium sp. NPDC089185]|uniref:MFS transporter n=1 Tax=Curtobacterium sp. NPDC089185 TaxID=3154968 RepID=UPI003429A8DF
MSSPKTVTAPTIGKPFPLRFTLPMLLGSALNPINSSLIATALAPIAHGIGVPLGQTTALVTVLYLATAIAQPTAGKAAEVFGPRRVFLTGIVLVLLGGTLGGFGQNLLMLVVARILIGLGTSCAYPTAMLLIRRRATDAGLDRPPGGIMGALQIAGIAIASLGLPIGGALVGAFGWRSVFFVNLPVAAITLVSALIWVPASETRSERLTFAGLARKLDLVGIVAFAAAMTTTLLFLFGLPHANWTLLAVAAVLWVGMVLWEGRAFSPFIDVRLLITNQALSATYLRFGLVMFCIAVLLYGLTAWLQSAVGVTETAAGLLLLPMTLVGGIVIIPIARRNAVRGPLLWAAGLSVLAAAATCLLTSTTPLWIVIVITVAFGIVMGASTSGGQTALYSRAAADQFGTASGLFRTFSYIGSIAATAVTGVVFSDGATDHGMRTLGLIMLGVTLAAGALTLGDRTIRRATPST